MRHPREYPTGFGKRLLQAYTRSCDQPPRKDLRRKFALDIRKTDRELFQEYPCNPDQWFDAELPKTFWYLAGSRSLRIPDSWAEAIGDFKKELHQACVQEERIRRMQTELQCHYRRPEELRDDTMGDPGATHFAEADGEFMAGRKAHSLGHGHPTSPETPPVRVPTGKSASMATMADSPHSVHEDPYNQDAQSKFATPSPVSESFVPAKKGRISVEGTDRNPIFVTRYDETPESAQHDVAHGKMVAKKKANSCAKSTTDEASMVDSGNKYDKYYHQMRRYVTPRKDGTMLASPDAIKMWRTESGRAKLREMLIQHGNFGAVECEIVRYQKTLMDNSKQGGWVTKHYLTKEKHWTTSMVSAAVEWAKSKNLWRVNPIHKEEEIKVVVDDFFRFSEQEGFDTTQRGTMEMEDHDGALLDAGDVIPEKMSKLLPEVKDEKGEDEAQPGTGASFRILKTLDNLLALMNKGYEDLSLLQGDALTGTIDVPTIKAKMNEITRADVAMNNVLVRGRNIKAVVPAKASPKASPKRASVPKAKAKAKVRSAKRALPPLPLQPKDEGTSEGASELAVGLVAPRAQWLRSSLGACWATTVRTMEKKTSQTFPPPQNSRLKQFPGLQGQGHDCIVVNKWLSHLCDEIDRENLDEEDHQLFDALKFAADCGNHWFRELYRFGVWIPGAEGEQLSHAAYGLTEGYQALARLCAMRRLHLFRVKPKLHMHDHVSRLGSNTFQF
ncbi:unnamed protein product [Cladocopium goreaui]|uniref:Uncharacterized protein n=1 Tax=Cladocopium goreaui TaxID=2562237 RepID=A0A9P1GP91_9DINO|nr:unnamed protein product [Cladocopium goreaui]